MINNAPHFMETEISARCKRIPNSRIQCLFKIEMCQICFCRIKCMLALSCPQHSFLQICWYANKALFFESTSYRTLKTCVINRQNKDSHTNAIRRQITNHVLGKLLEFYLIRSHEFIWRRTLKNKHTQHFKQQKIILIDLVR